MDRRVKERLVGASILVVLIVLIVPELLSGPAQNLPVQTRAASAPEPVRNVTVDLATVKPPAVVDAAVDAAASAASAVPEPAPSAVPQPVADAAPMQISPRAVAPAPLETPPPPPTSAAATKSTGHAWAVQLGSFASHANADKLVHQLRSQGFQVYVLWGDPEPPRATASG